MPVIINYNQKTVSEVTPVTFFPGRAQKVFQVIKSQSVSSTLWADKIVLFIVLTFHN